MVEKALWCVCIYLCVECFVYGWMCGEAMEEIENDLSTYSFKRVIVLLLMLSDDKIILVQTQTKYCDSLEGDLYHPYMVVLYLYFIMAEPYLYDRSIFCCN